MMLPFVFLLAWSAVFAGQSQTLSSDLEVELKSMKKILGQQAHRLRVMEINLHRVLSKVVALGEAYPRDLSERLDQLLAKMEHEESTRTLLEAVEKSLRSRACDTTASDVAVSKVPEPPQVNFSQPGLSGCHELDQRQRVDGVYRFLVPELNELERDFHERHCAFAGEGPAWTVIQRRGFLEPPENFNRSWEEYRAGFGNLSADFWFGNEFAHKLVYRDDHELRVELTSTSEQEAPHLDWAEYALFRLDSEVYNYQLSVDGGFRGTLPDSLEPQNQLDFSTHDRRSDPREFPRISRPGAEDPNCAESFGGGWWLGGCSRTNLNGHQGIQQRIRPAFVWSGWTSGIEGSGARSSRMMIRPVGSGTDKNSRDYED